MNEIFNQRIQSVQFGKNMTHAHIVAKRELREELETEMEKYLARGGQIKQASNQRIQIKHGTGDQFNKKGCRCEACVDWAKSKGRIKGEYLYRNFRHDDFYFESICSE